MTQDLSPRLDRLRSLWINLWGDLGFPPPQSEVLNAYCQPTRHYHTSEHLEEVLGWVPQLPLPQEDRCLLQLALFYHDAVYNSRRHDNELLSAQWARQELQFLGVERVEAVADLIMDTLHQKLPRSPLGCWMVDVDLAILGSDWERVLRYHQDVRREYSWVPWFFYRFQRRKVLRAFLARSQLYHTAYFRDRLEVQARANLARLLEVLSS